jgi:hypothetical protein
MSDAGPDDIERGVRRRVGIAALRRLRRMVDAEREMDATNARWARRLIWAFALAAVAAVGWLAFVSARIAP